MKKIYTGLNYYEKIDFLIEDCISKATNNPFKEYIFICESPTLVEKRFFHYTNKLVNIRVLSYSQYLNLFINQYHLSHIKVLTTTELTYLIYKILKTESFDYLKDPTFSFVKDLCTLVKDYHLNMIQYKSTSSKKLNEFKKLVDCVNASLNDSTYLTNEELVLDHISLEKDHIYYIDGDLFLNNISVSLLNQLEKNNDLYISYTCSKDDRLLNMPMSSLSILGEDIGKDNLITSYLFNSKVTQSNEVMYKLTGATQLDEVTKVTSLIHQYIVDEGCKYSDFTIYYPNDDYKDILVKSCLSRGLITDLQTNDSLIYDSLYLKLLDYIRENHCHSLKDLSLFKLNTKDINSPIYHTFTSYLELLSHYDMPMSSKEIFDFFTSTFTYEVVYKNTLADYIHITDYDHPFSNECKYVFYLGLNETVLPETIKDQSLLLDEDIEILKELNSPVPFNSLERQGNHENHILKAFLIDSTHKYYSYALTTLDNDELLPSSLAKQLEELFTVKEINQIDDQTLEEYYLNNHQLVDKEKVNNAINEYKSTKHNFNPIDKDVIKELYPSKVSVSQLETYNKCPFEYFLKYGLNIKPTIPDTFKPNELGSLVHYVLENCVNTDKDINDVIDDYIENGLEHNRLKEVMHVPMNYYFIDNLKKDLPDTLSIVNQFISNSSYTVLEKELEVNDTIAGIPFKGYVDRIDTYNNQIMIVDYKPSTNKDIDLSLAMQGFNIQMLMYLRAACKQLNKDPAAVLYFAYKKRMLKSDLNMDEDIDVQKLLKEYQYHGYVLDDAIHDLDKTDDKVSLPIKYVKKDNAYKGHVISQDALDKLYTYIEKHISMLYKNMLDGVISLTPKGSENTSTHASINPCSYCDYKAVCQIDHFYNEYTMVEDLDVDTLLYNKEGEEE